MSSRSPDAIIVGDGVVGLASALAAARSGASCTVVGRTITGAASAASAGLLAPSIGGANQLFRTFMVASRDRYPSWVDWLIDRTGIEITLNRLGIIDLSPAVGAGDVLDTNTLHSLEPAIAHDGPAVLFPDDGYVDNVQLLAALRVAAQVDPRITLLDDRAINLEASLSSCTITTERGTRVDSATAVLAAGAWSASIAGVPRALPVEPLRGQMLQLEGCLLDHAVSLENAYLVPRGPYTLVGSTAERVGFEAATTSAALETLRRAAAATIPALGSARTHRAWAGLRPMTPDGMPLLGRDPERPGIVYACGHGKNGILLAPITGECVASLLTGSRPEFDLSHFRVERFDSTANSTLAV